MKSNYENYYKEFGSNIAYYRKKKNLTQEQLALKIGSSQSQLSKIEVAMVGVSLDMLFTLSEALEVAPYKLLKFRDE